MSGNFNILPVQKGFDLPVCHFVFSEEWSKTCGRENDEKMPPFRRQQVVLIGCERQARNESRWDDFEDESLLGREWGSMAEESLGDCISTAAKG